MRVEQQQLGRGHPLYDVITDYCIRSKNFYNYATYTVRQEFINNGQWLGYRELQSLLKDSEPYKSLMSQSSQCVLRLIEKTWKSYFVAIKDWKVNKYKYLGMPKLPNYKKDGVKFTWFLKNSQAYIKNGRLYFRLKCMNKFSFKTNVTDKLMAIRFVPRNGVYVLEIIYEKEVDVDLRFSDSNVLGIDLGVNNFITMTNNMALQPVVINGKGIKSINEYYNKKRASVSNELSRRNNKYWSNKLDTLNRKRHNRLKNYIHNSSRFIINYCESNDIGVIILGHNKKWKHKCNIGHKNTQTFTSIPYDMLINQLEYKCKESGISFITTEESYTSGTSFLDEEIPIKENYNKNRRIKRGLFKSDSGRLINSDVNGSLQIIKKVFPNAFDCYGIEGNLNPVVINICKM